uniref:Uncharacterized protein n=1 Tax=Cacopsylla melanoneura TaxID=428564 RepID=A0A8D8UJH4_9HEMI
MIVCVWFCGLPYKQVGTFVYNQRLLSDSMPRSARGLRIKFCHKFINRKEEKQSMSITTYLIVAKVSSRQAILRLLFLDILLLFRLRSWEEDTQRELSGTESKGGNILELNEEVLNDKPVEEPKECDNGTRQDHGEWETGGILLLNNLLNS